MTPEEIKASIAKIEANSAIPEKQKNALLEKYNKMLSEATGKKPEPPAPAKPAAPAPKKASTPKKKATPSTKKDESKKSEQNSGKEEYNCDELIADVKAKKAKQRARAKEKAKEPKKTPATKNKEAVEKVVTKVTAGVEKRIDTKKVSISEIEKLIDGAKEYLKTLEAILTKAKDAGIMAKGGSVDNEVYSNFAKEAKSIKVGHCGCSGSKMAKGGNVNGFVHVDLARDFEKHKKALNGDLRVNTDEIDEKDGLWFILDINDDTYNYANKYDRDHDRDLLLQKLGLPQDFGKGGKVKSFDAWFSKNKGGDLAQDYINYKGQLESEMKEHVLSFREWAKKQYENRYAKGGALGKKKAIIDGLMKKANYLFENCISNGGTLDYSDKEYGYLIDEIEDVEVGYYKKTSAEVDSTHAEELRAENFSMTADDAITTLTHRIESIEEELADIGTPVVYP